MNVFKKMTTNIFATEKKKTSLQPPESALKIDLTYNHDHCYFLIDYELKADQLLVCTISKDQTLKKLNSKRLAGTKTCMVKEKIEMQNLWVGKRYCFVNLSSLATK
jgi:hypothetical protein